MKPSSSKSRGSGFPAGKPSGAGKHFPKARVAHASGPSASAPRAPINRADTQWTDADTQRLRDGLAALSLSLDEAVLERVVRWASLLKQWNRTYNLLGNSTSTELIEGHLLDSLVVLPVLQRLLPNVHEPLFDIGTGAGFPGILIAIAQRERPVFLVEPVGKKVAFLRQSVLTLGLRNATVLSGKIEDLEALLAAAGKAAPSNAVPPGAAPSSDAPGSAAPSGTATSGTATSGTTPSRVIPSGVTPADEAARSPARSRHFICRAFTALGRFASLCEPYMSERSLALAMKSVRLTEEQEALPPGIAMPAVETLPTLDPAIQRYLAVLCRTVSAHDAPPGIQHNPVQPPTAQPDRRRSV